MSMHRAYGVAPRAGRRQARHVAKSDWRALSTQHRVDAIRAGMMRVAKHMKRALITRTHKRTRRVPTLERKQRCGKFKQGAKMNANSTESGRSSTERCRQRKHGNGEHLL